MTDLLMSMHPDQSESLYAFKFVLFSAKNNMPQPMVPFNYHNTLKAT